jgi:hypothetical protein
MKKNKQEQKFVNILGTIGGHNPNDCFEGKTEIQTKETEIEGKKTELVIPITKPISPQDFFKKIKK